MIEFWVAELGGMFGKSGMFEKSERIRSLTSLEDFYLQGVWLVWKKTELRLASPTISDNLNTTTPLPPSLSSTINPHFNMPFHCFPNRNKTTENSINCCAITTHSHNIHLHLLFAIIHCQNNFQLGVIPFVTSSIFIDTLLWF
jgi:hypothetical protein